MDGKADGCKVDGGKATWHPYGLIGPQGTSNGNFLCSTINHSQPSLYMERSHKIRVLMQIFPTRKLLPRQETKVGSTLL